MSEESRREVRAGLEPTLASAFRHAARLIFCKPACEFTGRFLIDATFSLISASPDLSHTKSTQRRILQSISSCHDCVAPAPLARTRA